MTIFKFIADLIMLVAPVCLFCLWYVKRKTKKDTPSFCNYDLFEYFADTYDLVLLNGEIEDIKSAVYKNISDDIHSFSDDDLYDVFECVIKEINSRKAGMNCSAAPASATAKGA